jgi:hypothetical protein
MRIVFEPSGTHVDNHGNLKARLDFYPEVGEKSYDSQHVFVIDEKSPEWQAGYKGELDKDGQPVDQKDFDLWEASLPHIWRTNPCVCHFVTVPPDIDKTNLDAWVKATFHADAIATVDDIMSKTGEHESAHLISPYMRGKSMTTAKLWDDSGKTSVATAVMTEMQTKGLLTVAEASATTAVQLAPVKVKVDSYVTAKVSTALADFSIGGEKDGTIEDVKPGSIDVGPGSTNRAYELEYRYGTSAYTEVSKDNPANADGVLDTFQTYISRVDSAGTLKLGTFSASGNTLTCRDSESAGTISSIGSKTFTGMTVNVLTGDYIGGSATSGDDINVDADYSGGAGVWYKAAEYIDPSDSATFSFGTNYIVSIYATGTEAGGTTYEHVVTEDMTVSTALARANCSFQNVQRDAMVTRQTGPNNMSMQNSQLQSMRMNDLTRGNASFQNSQLQSMVTSDLSKVGLAFWNTLLDSARLSDLTRGQGAFQNSQLDSARLSDLSRGQASYQNSQLDKAIINNLARGQGSFQNRQLDSLRIVDGSFTQVTFESAVLDLIRYWDAPWGDLVAGGINYYNTVVEALALSDSPASFGEFMNAVRSTLILLANTSVTMSFQNAQRDSLVLADDVTAQRTASIQITDSVVLADGSQTQVSFAVTATDALQVIDAIATAVSFYSAVSDSIVITDLATTLEAGATRLIYVTFKLTLRSKTLEVNNRSLTMEIGKRNLTMTLGG